MGSKQRKQIAKARNLQRQLKESLGRAEMAADNFKREVDRLNQLPKLQYAIPSHGVAGPRLQWNFTADLFALQHLSSAQRALMLEDYARRAAKELNEKYPPREEWTFATDKKGATKR